MLAGVVALFALIIVASFFLKHLTVYYMYLNSFSYYRKKLSNPNMTARRIHKIAKSNKIINSQDLCNEIMLHKNSSMQSIMLIIDGTNMEIIPYLTLRSFSRSVEILKETIETSDDTDLKNHLIRSFYPSYSFVDYVMSLDLSDRVVLIQNPNLTEYAEKLIIQDPSEKFRANLFSCEPYRKSECAVSTVMSGLSDPSPFVSSKAYEIVAHRGLWREALEHLSGEQVDPRLPSEWMQKMFHTFYNDLVE